MIERIGRIGIHLLLVLREVAWKIYKTSIETRLASRWSWIRDIVIKKCIYFLLPSRKSCLSSRQDQKSKWSDVTTHGTRMCFDMYRWSNPFYDSHTHIYIYISPVALTHIAWRQLSRNAYFDTIYYRADSTDRSMSYDVKTRFKSNTWTKIPPSSTAWVYVASQYAAQCARPRFRYIRRESTNKNTDNGTHTHLVLETL